MKIRIAALSLALVAVAFFFLERPRAQQSELPMAKPESVGMSTKRFEPIHQYIQGYIDRGEIAGATTLVARRGKIVHFDAQGFRYKEENAPMQKDTIFSLMSMTKPIVSTALMMLWEEGRFMLDDPISKWLPSYANKQVLDTVSGRRVAARNRPFMLDPAPARPAEPRVPPRSRAPRDRAAHPDPHLRALAGAARWRRSAGRWRRLRGRD